MGYELISVQIYYKSLNLKLLKESCPDWKNVIPKQIIQDISFLQEIPSSGPSSPKSSSTKKPSRKNVFLDSYNQMITPTKTNLPETNDWKTILFFWNGPFLEDMSVFAGVSSSLFPKKIHPKKKTQQKNQFKKKKHSQNHQKKKSSPPKKVLIIIIIIIIIISIINIQTQKSSHKKIVDSSCSISSIHPSPPCLQPKTRMVSTWATQVSTNWRYTEGREKIVANPSNNQEMMGVQKVWFWKKTI